MLGIKQAADKQEAVNKLRVMGLDEISRWVESLPDSRWETIFASRWVSLAKDCGVNTETERIE